MLLLTATAAVACGPSANKNGETDESTSVSETTDVIDSEAEDTEANSINGESEAEETSGDTESVTETDSDDSDVEETEDEKEIEIKDFSIGGVKRDYNMLVMSQRTHFMISEGASADRVEKATFERNSLISQNFGVNFKMDTTKGDKAEDWVNMLSTSGSDLDLAAPDYWWQLERLGLFINLQDRPELDFSNSWWYAGWNNIMTVNGKQYSCVGDLNLDVWENLEMMFFNADMEAAQNADIHKMVRDGSWTVEAMKTMGKKASIGLDTNATDDDVYGVYYNYHSYAAQMFSAGLKLIDIKDNRIDVIAQSRIENLSIFEECRDLKNDAATYFTLVGTGNGDHGNAMFENGKMMFYGSALKVLKYLDGGFNFGIAVMPKCEGQENYVTTGYGLCSSAIPKVAEDPNFSATILNALNYYSGDTVVSEYYEVVLKLKSAPDVDSKEMIDIARDTMYYDLAWVMDDGANGLMIFDAFEDATNKSEGQVQLDAVMSQANIKIAELIDYYNK